MISVWPVQFCQENFKIPVKDKIFISEKETPQYWRLCRNYVQLILKNVVTAHFLSLNQQYII